jgi:hypothetical protein
MRSSLAAAAIALGRNERMKEEGEEEGEVDDALLPLLSFAARARALCVCALARC